MEQLVLHRIITDAELETARFPEVIVCETINSMRAAFYPAENLVTKVQRFNFINGTVFEMSLDANAN